MSCSPSHGHPAHRIDIIFLFHYTDFLQLHFIGCHLFVFCFFPFVYITFSSHDERTFEKKPTRTFDLRRDSCHSFYFWETYGVGEQRKARELKKTWSGVSRPLRLPCCFRGANQRGSLVTKVRSDWSNRSPTDSAWVDWLRLCATCFCISG